MPRTTFPDERREALLQLSSEDRAAVENLLHLQTVISRTQLGMRLGKSFRGRRDVYIALGYPKELSFSDSWNKYTRQDIAKRIVNAYPDATWRGRPVLVDDADPKVDTEFERDWTGIAEDKRVWHYFNRADRLCGIGQYSVLYLGFDDIKKGGKTPQEPVSGATKLLYLQPYSEMNAEIHSVVTDIENERYGLPETYKLNVSTQTISGRSQTDSGSQSRIKVGKVVISGAGPAAIEKGLHLS